MSNPLWIGVDIAKDSFHAAIAGEGAQPAQWSRLPEAGFEHSRRGVRSFVAWAKQHGGTLRTVAGVCIESTGHYSGQFADFLGDRLGPIAIVNPARPVAYAKSMGIRDKSDRVDACVLALFGMTMQPRPAQRRSQTQRELRALSRTYQTMSVDSRAYRQRLGSGLHSAAAKRSIRQILKALRHQMHLLQEQMKALIATDSVLKRDHKRAMTIKGVGPKTATIILAEFGDLREYNRDEFVALAGLYPRETSSGSSVHKRPRMIKAGKAGVRAHLYMCAMTAIKHNPRMRAFAKRLEANGKIPMQILGAVMRKLLMLVRAVIVSGKDYDTAYHPAA